MPARIKLHLAASAAILFVCAAVTVPLAVAATSTAKTPDPKAMVVRTKDLPRGFLVRPGSGYVSNETAQATEARKGEHFAALGRANGYLALFHGQESGGPVVVTSEATVFTSVVGAHRALEYIERDGADSQRYRPLPVTVVGNEARLYQELGVANTYLIAWRSGSVFSTVLVDGAEAVDAVKLSKRQQYYISRAQ